MMQRDVTSHSGTILHVRNLDYGIPDLQNVTVNVDFTQKGSVVYRGTTFVGYVGLLTGVRPGFTFNGPLSTS